jgi:RNA polymerase sigma factor (sigma-70 family)
LADEKRKEDASYEDLYPVIDREIRKRRGKWSLSSLAWIDYDDVSQIIRAHIFNKWTQWDQERALLPWVNKIITNQLKNILRNYYSNFVRPCLSCPFNQAAPTKATSGAIDSLCGFTSSGLQDNECPLFAKWEKTKKYAYDIKMPVALEHHTHEVRHIEESFYDIETARERLNRAMKEALTDRQHLVYDLLFIQNKSEEAVAEMLGFKTTEKGRKAGYKQIKNLKKLFAKKAAHILQTQDIIV